jgi:N-acetylglucosaminyldiphosphoundecaprenol N-acetyl-beta-D-mannosaminyltransferase
MLVKSPFPEALDVLGVDILDLPMDEALARIGALLEGPADRARSIFFINASTLNLAAEDPEFMGVLNGAEYVFGDGTGVRWAARYLHGRRLRDNVNGTDFVPRFFANTSGRGYRYFLLGATPEASVRAAQRAQELFPGWQLAGFRHGYFDQQDETELVDAINATNPQLLLVGMGNPRQELFIARNLHRLSAPLCLGVGGLFTYWSGDLQRAPAWVRRLGCEWVHLLVSQPHKFRRYVFGNPVFLYRMVRYGIHRKQVFEPSP